MRRNIKEMERLYDLLSDENREILLKHARRAKQEQARQERRRKKAGMDETVNDE